MVDWDGKNANRATPWHQAIFYTTSHLIVGIATNFFSFRTSGKMHVGLKMYFVMLDHRYVEVTNSFLLGLELEIHGGGAPWLVVDGWMDGRILTGRFQSFQKTVSGNFLFLFTSLRLFLLLLLLLLLLPCCFYSSTGLRIDVKGMKEVGWIRLGWAGLAR